jgi:protein CpxP
MSFFTHPIAMSAPLKRTVAITALMGAAMLLNPMTGARAASDAPTRIVQDVHPQNSAAREAVSTKAETVEERIASLHGKLVITPDEEANWTGVAQTMRDNAAMMEKLSSEKTAKDPESMTAIEDLKTYEKFAHAHFDGLKNLIASFETLYKSMPDQQKKVADEVFESFGHEAAPSHG